MDELTKAILAASEELRKEYCWSVGDDGENGRATPDGELVTIMRKHIAPLIDHDEFNKTLRAKAAALRAEADELDRIVGDA